MTAPNAFMADCASISPPRTLFMPRSNSRVSTPTLAYSRAISPAMLFTLDQLEHAVQPPHFPQVAPPQFVQRPPGPQDQPRLDVLPRHRPDLLRRLLAQ